MEPAVLNTAQVAALMGRKVRWFYVHRAELEKEGFPKRDKLLGGWLRQAVQQWLDKRSGAVPQSRPWKGALDRVLQDEARSGR
jgi:predicted DNA-binding transcriptional regulator AlpA